MDQARKTDSAGQTSTGPGASTATGNMADAIDRLFAAVLAERAQYPRTSATAKLFAAGRVKIAKKVVEEAAEVSLAYMDGDRREIVGETADLIYNLVVLLVEAGIAPAEIWAEMAAREARLGLAAKPPKKWRT